MDPVRVMDNCVILQLSFSCMGLVRKVSTSAVDVKTAGSQEDVPMGALRLSKRLLDSPAFDAICSADGAFERKIKRLALPFQRGFHFLPIGLVERAIGDCREYAEVQRPALVDAFVSDYANAVEQARKDLGPLFDEEDYPTVEDVRSTFKVRYRVLEFGVPGKLRAISPALFEAEAEKAREQWQDAAAMMQDSMRQAFQALVASLRERLDGNRENGKSKVFKDTRINNLQEWLGLFEVRNVASDEALALLVQKAKGLLSGVSADTLRRRGDIREEVAGGLKEIEQVCSTLVVADAPRRKFRLDGES
jgi:hypothetical protein